MNVYQSALQAPELAENFSPNLLLPAQDFLNEIETFFRMGSDAALLSAAEKEKVASELADILDHYDRLNLPLLSQVFRERLAGLDANEALDILPSGQNDSYSLSEAERTFFSYYGILPPYKLKTMGDNDLLAIERQVDSLAKRRLNSSAGYMFSKELLDLALNPEIVSRVSSLLGNDITFLGCSGPMYKPPGSVDATPWHNASARTFGGGFQDSNLDLVTCWVALSDATQNHGCMKMLPRSFSFNSLKLELLSVRNDDVTFASGIVDFLKALDYRVESEVVEKMLCRQKTFSRIEGMFIRDGSTRRYNVFQGSVDTLMALGASNLKQITSSKLIVMEAKRGEMYTFTSQNTHGSFKNSSSSWRKAIALRYVKTGAARPNIGDDSYELLKLYLKNFSLAQSVLDKLGTSVEAFRSASPRLRIKGLVPAAQKDFYIDPEQLREILNHPGFNPLS